MPKHIVQQTVKIDFAIDELFLQKLEEKDILVVSNLEKELVYVCSTDEVAVMADNIQKVLRLFENLGEQSLLVMGLMKKIKYMEIITNIKVKSALYNDIFIPEPISNDNMKFKILFYGPRKKNDAFFEEIKKKIEKLESELGQYCLSIDSR